MILFLANRLSGVDVMAQQRNWGDVAVAMFEGGRLIWTTHNMGRTCGNPAWDTFYWPVNTHDNKSQHAITGSFVFAVENNVIESFSDPDRINPDWMPKPGSLGYYHASNQPDEMMVNGVYPRMAVSSMPQSWPKRSRANPSVRDPNGEAYWPGRMAPGSTNNDRFNLSAPFAASDEDAFCVFSDHNNRTSAPLGIEVQEQIYRYTRDYAADMAFIEYLVINTSTTDIKNAYIGYYFYPYAPGGGITNDDYLSAYDTEYDKDSKPDVIYCYDPFDNGQTPKDADSDWPNHRFALFVLRTPLTTYDAQGGVDELGVTDFHYFFARGPTQDSTQWAIVSSNPNSPALRANKSFYFHDAGPDDRIDNTDWIPKNVPNGSEWAYFVMSGPVDLAAGDSTWFTIGFTAGVGPDQFEKNVASAQLLAKSGFLGPGPPSPPTLSAVPGDHVIRLFWDDAPEYAVDPFSGVQDFEGYKIYRLAKGPYGREDWGQEITNSSGDIVGHVPLAQFDKADGIVGIDPLWPFQNLGNDTGLRHSFVDSSVVNGVQYTYCITVYDKGDTSKQLQSYESGKTTGATARNVASGIPGTEATGLVLGATLNDTLFVASADSGCYVTIDVIDPHAITGHAYALSFSDFTSLAGQLVYQQGFNLLDKTTGEQLLRNAVLTDRTAGGDNTPFVNGLRFNFHSNRWPINTGIIDLDWLSPASTQDGARLPYWHGKRYLPEDLEITVDTTNPVILPAFSGYGSATYRVPLRVKNIKTGEDLSQYMKVMDMAGRFPGQQRYNAITYPAGSWDLSPGGACWNPVVDSLMTASGFNAAMNSTDQLIGYNASGAVVFALYAVHPPDATPPKDGDKFYLGTRMGFPRDAVLPFSTAQAHTDESRVTASALDAIRVVPNPYIVTEAWDIYIRMGKVMFTHLPAICDIRIYTVAGDLVKTIEHRGIREAGNPTPGSFTAADYTLAGLGYEEWDLTTNNQLAVAFGLYVYVVETPNGMKKVGKLAIVR